jgi:hypothetical protein
MGRDEDAPDFPARKAHDAAVDMTGIAGNP